MKIGQRDGSIDGLRLWAACYLPPEKSTFARPGKAPPVPPMYTSRLLLLSRTGIRTVCSTRPFRVRDIATARVAGTRQPHSLRIRDQGNLPVVPGCKTSPPAGVEQLTSARRDMLHTSGFHELRSTMGVNHHRSTPHHCQYDEYAYRTTTSQPGASGSLARYNGRAYHAWRDRDWGRL